MTSKAEKYTIAMVAPCPFPTFQGTQVFIRALANGLSRAGHTVHLITYGHGEYESDFDFHLHRTMRLGKRLRSGPGFAKPAADMALFMKAERILKTYRCDFLHVHNVEGLGIGALLRLHHQIPLVYHAHNAMGPELPTYFKAHLVQAFAGVVGDVLDRTLPKVAHGVITLDETQRAFHEQYGIDAERLHIVPAGIEPKDLEEPELETIHHVQDVLGDGPWLIYAGNPDNYQNLELLWDALPLIRQERPEAKLLIATSYEPETFAQLIPSYIPEEALHIYRYHSLAELKALFAVADVGLSPRKIWAGVPIKILNYLATGLPVVACKSASRYLLDEGCGALVEDNPESFAQGVLETLKKPKGRQQKLRKNFERFQISGQIELYEAVYRKVLEFSAK
jgi:glycosyltransferase involved in cell wall biosynthesis